MLPAGLWKFQQLPEGTVTQVFVVLTTRANAVMAPIHDRMLVVLDESQVDTWMNPATSEASGALVPTPSVRRLARRR